MGRWAGQCLLSLLCVACATTRADEGLSVHPDAFAPHVLSVPGEAMLLDPPRPEGEDGDSASLAGVSKRLESGLASWYGARFHRRRTASGEPFDMHALTAAHRTLPFGTRVCVRSLVTGRSVVVRINDRGPHLANRVIDLSQAAADRLGSKGLGVKKVSLHPMLGANATCSDIPASDLP